MKEEEKLKAAEEYAFMNWESEDYHKGASERVSFDPIEHTKNTFIAGVEWAEKTIIEKVVEWLDEYISDLADVDTRILIGSFKNYMEGKL